MSTQDGLKKCEKDGPTKAGVTLPIRGARDEVVASTVQGTLLPCMLTARQNNSLQTM